MTGVPLDTISEEAKAHTINAMLTINPDVAGMVDRERGREHMRELVKMGMPVLLMLIAAVASVLVVINLSPALQEKVTPGIVAALIAVLGGQAPATIRAFKNKEE